MTKQTHYFDTADEHNYEIAKAAADKFGLEMHSEIRPTCFKQYHFEITARGLDQIVILDMIIAATFAHRGQAESRQELINRIYA